MGIGGAFNRFTAIVLLVFSQLLQAETAPFEFLYIEANEGTASGGHVAARLGDEVFHYQHVSPGLLRLYRDDFQWFTRHYGTHENRNIHAHPIKLPATALQRLYDGLEHRRLVQDEQYATLQSVSRQIALLRLLRTRQQTGLAYLSVAGAGLFNRMETTTQEPSLVALRQEVEDHSGTGMLQQKITALTQELEHPHTMLQPHDNTEFSRLNYRPITFSAAENYKDLLLLRCALEVLIHAHPLQQNITLEPAPAEFILGSQQKQALERYRQKLHEELRGLALNPHPDKALALISGMAQLAVISRSIDSGKLLFLNTRENPPAIQKNGQHIEHGGILQALFTNAREQWLQAKARLDQTENLSELDYRLLEKAANAFMYFRLSMASPAPADLVGFQTVPEKNAELALPRSDLPDAEIQAAITQLEQLQANLTAQLYALYGYNLILRNCVTELLLTLNEILPDNSPETNAFKQIGLQPFAFIPFASYALIESSYDATKSHLLPSHRNRLLELAETTENPAWIALRESNTLSATLYQAQTQTPAFLFFTEDAIWPRPLQGYLNTALGLVQMGSGVLSLPWDNGETLKLGASGLLVSLPELFFFNIRKGTYPEWTQPIP